NSSLKVTSESGAEYSYYNVSVDFLSLALRTFACKIGLGSLLLSPEALRFHENLLSSSEPLLGYKAEVISPASERQIQRAMPSARLVMVTETRESMIDDLYCLAIIQERGIATLRDLRSRHIPVLKSILSSGLSTISSLYGVPPPEVRVFVHYHPQFYHLHVHFTRLWNDGGAQVERAHLLEDVIQNLEGDGEYYVGRTMFYKLNEAEKLAKAIFREEGGGGE
ncbi:hypothetical protein TrRE_jg10180, partial [Triparma retinervis]